MGLRGQRAVTISGGHAVRFLVTLIGRSSVALPAQWVRGIVTPASAGPDRLITWAGVPYNRTDLAARLKIVSQGLSLDTRFILYGNEEQSRSFALDKVVGLLDVERELIHPLPPQFRGQERERWLGFFVDTSSVALIANPFWALELPLRPQALEIFAIRFLERKPGERESRLHLPAPAMDEAVSMSTGQVESRQAFFNCVAKLDVAIRQRLEDAAERVILLGDDYGAQAVQAVLDSRREDDAAVLTTPSDRHSRSLHLCILQEFPEAGARREARFDQAEHEQVMHRQWKSEHFSSHYLGPKGVEPKRGDDIQEALRKRSAELFPHVPKERILIEQFVRCSLSHAQREDDDEADDEPLTQLHTLCATFNGSTAHYRQVEDGQVVDHEEPAAMSARFSWEPATGALTVFCEDREKRRELATIFRDVALAHEGAIDDMPMRQFDLLGFSTSAMLKRLEQDRLADIERIDILQIKVAKPFEQLFELSGKTVARQLASKREITRDRRDSRNVYQVAYEDYAAEDLSQYALVQVKLVMRMAPQPHRKAHNVAVQITAPNGLKDKSKTEDDRKRVLEQLIRLGVLSEF